MISTFVEHAQIIIVAVVALSSALVGLAGGVFATVYAQRRQSKREKFKELRNMLFTAMSESGQILAWADKDIHFYLKCNPEEFRATEKRVASPPTEKIRVVTALYFPQIRLVARKLAIAALEHRAAAYDVGRARIENMPEETCKELQDAASKIWSEMNDLREDFERMAYVLMTRLIDEKPVNFRKAHRLFRKLWGVKSGEI